MNQFNLSFSPLLPSSVLIGFGVLALIVVALGFYARRRGTWLRALGLGLLLLALADPSLVREDRAGLKDVVAVVVDQSGSQTIGERQAQTEKASAALQRDLNALGNVDVRVIDSGRDGYGRTTAPACFRRSTPALPTCPPSASAACS